MNIVSHYDPGAFRFEGYSTTNYVVASIKSKTSDVRVILLSLIGTEDFRREIQLLLRHFSQSRIIVEIDKDDPEIAFKIVRLGAFNVVCSAVTKTESLWDTITKAATGQPRPYGYFLKVSRPHKKWGFMSMTFNPRDQNHNDYYFAVKPTTERLKLELDRVDDLSYEGLPDLRSLITKAISERPVFVAQISSNTTNTAWEIGLACQQKKTVLPLRRSTSNEPIPALLQGLAYVEYSTMTELAMKLFFGLGGTVADL